MKKSISSRHASTVSRLKVFHLVLTIITILCISLVAYLSSSRQVTTSNQSQALGNDLRRLAAELSETQHSLVHSLLHFYRVERHIQLVHKIIKSLDGKSVNEYKIPPPAGDSSKNAAQKREVCPEKFMGKNSAYGFPFYRKGFETVNCTDFVAIDQLVTMIVTSPEELSSEQVHQLFQGISTYYPKVPVIFVSKTNFNLTRPKELELNLKNKVFDDLTHGETWSKLLKSVTTPYVLFAPDITYFTDDVNLKRLVRVLSETEDTIIAGGSHKNQRGEWNKGCLQVVFRNWTAYFVDGYYHSFNDCIVCDVLPGPFMAKTKGLKELGINEKLHFGAFQDLFWRLKLKDPERVVVSCPDVMFETHEREIPDEKYVDLAQMWNVKKWVESNGRVRWYGCRIGGHPHDNKSSCGTTPTGLAVPPCDLENLADIIKFIMKECENAGSYCELMEGSLIGAVKFNKILPWERDADIQFLSENYTAIQKLRPRFEAAGYKFDDREGTKCCEDGRKTSGVIVVYKNGWGVDIYGRTKLESELLVASGQRPTKVMLTGQWMTVNRNPGLSARNRYGPNIYKHVQHWYDVGYKNGVMQYKSGVFTKCPSPDHTACLDHFPADGSLQFSDCSIF